MCGPAKGLAPAKGLHANGLCWVVFAPQAKGLGPGLVRVGGGDPKGLGIPLPLVLKGEVLLICGGWLEGVCGVVDGEGSVVVVVGVLKCTFWLSEFGSMTGSAVSFGADVSSSSSWLSLVGVKVGLSQGRTPPSPSAFGVRLARLSSSSKFSRTASMKSCAFSF